MKPPDSLDDALRAALQRRPAPPGLAERVLAAADRPSARAPPARYALTAALALAVLGGALKLHLRELERGRAARAQVLLALHLAGSTLHYAQTRVTPELEAPHPDQEHP